VEVSRTLLFNYVNNTLHIYVSNAVTPSHIHTPHPQKRLARFIREYFFRSIFLRHGTPHFISCLSREI
jgi:hypothetical protein